MLISVPALCCASTGEVPADDPCVGAKSTNLSPLYYRFEDKGRHLREIEILGPLFHYRGTPGEKSWTLSPLLSYTRTREGTTFNFLYPLGRWKETDGVRHWRLTPLFDSGSYGDEAELPWQRSFWPVYWGRSRSGEAYGGLFPVYGTFLDRYGRDRIRFFFWPLLTRSTWDGHGQTTILWPIFARITGPREYGFKLFPIYGRFGEKNRWMKQFVLWPFFLREHSGLDSPNPTRKWALLPLYAEETREGFTSRTYIWPLFQFVRDSEKDFSQIDFPWPIFRRAKAPGYSHLRLWPIAGVKRTETETSRFLLWPIFTKNITLDQETGGTVTRERWLLFSKNFSARDEKGEVTERLIRIWPLWHYHRLRDGRRLAFFPAILPTDEPGFHRVYGPFLRLYEFRESSRGAGCSKALWGLYRHCWAEDRHRMEISGIVQIRWSETSLGWSLFGGLVGSGPETKGEDRVLFYKPVSWWGRTLTNLWPWQGHGP